MGLRFLVPGLSHGSPEILWSTKLLHTLWMYRMLLTFQRNLGQHLDPHIYGTTYKYNLERTFLDEGTFQNPVKQEDNI